ARFAPRCSRLRTTFYTRLSSYLAFPPMKMHRRSTPRMHESLAPCVKELRAVRLESLRSLLIEQLEDLYSAEDQIIHALPEMIGKITDAQLKSALREHLDVTRAQVSRLDRIFDDLSMERKREKCKGMEGLIKESKDILKTDADARDAGIIAVAQRVEHYEIARYGCARTYASLLGRSDWAELLEQTLN